jgi:hypothetical protein
MILSLIWKGTTICYTKRHNAKGEEHQILGAVGAMEILSLLGGICPFIVFHKTVFSLEESVSLLIADKTTTCIGIITF